MTDSEALKRAYNILAYAPNTASALRRKLTEKGASAEQAERISASLVECGYLDEADFLFRFVENQVSGKHYGRRRVVMAVKEKGFDPEIVKEYLDEALENVDFVAACRYRIAHATTTDGKKLLASLLRYGFDYETIKKASR